MQGEENVSTDTLALHLPVGDRKGGEHNFAELE